MTATALATLIVNIAGELGYATGVADTTGTSSELIDNSTDSPIDPYDSEDRWKNAWAKIKADTTQTSNVGAVRRIRLVNPSTGKLTMARAFPAVTTAAVTEYGLHFGLPPTQFGVQRGLTQYINDVLREVAHRELVLLSLGDDMDMETSGTTYWTGANSTLAKSTDYYKLGKASMTVIASVAGGYAGQAFLVSEGQVYNLAAMVRNLFPGKSATLQLYDVTNAAVIDSKTSSDAAWRFLYFQGTIPSGCEGVSVRLVTVTTGLNVPAWDNVSFLDARATTIVLPTWLASPAAVEQVYRWPVGTTHASDDSYAIDEYHLIPVDGFSVIHDQAASIPYRLEFWPSPQLGELLVASIWRPYTELSADTSTTDCPADLVKAGALYKIHNRAGPLPDAAKAAFWAKKYRYELRKLRGRPFTTPIQVGA